MYKSELLFREQCGQDVHKRPILQVSYFVLLGGGISDLVACRLDRA